MSKVQCMLALERLKSCWRNPTSSYHPLGKFFSKTLFLETFIGCFGFQIKLLDLISLNEMFVCEKVFKSLSQF